MAKVEETILELDLGALEHNYRYLKSLIAPKTKFLAVVKAFAYGSDANQIALKMQEIGVDYFAVAYTKEGINLREAGIHIPILVLHPQPAHFSDIIKYDLEPSIYSFRILEGFIDSARALHKKDYPVHLKFNTGLNRLGFSENDTTEIVTKSKNNDSIKIIAILSHLAASEDKNEKEFTKGQIAAFERISIKMDTLLGYRTQKHLLNTSGIINNPESQYDMVRSGIGLYGYGNHPQIDSQLKPVASLKTVISQLHHLQSGESVGYNRAFKLANQNNLTIATLPLGHADGIGRQYGKGSTYVTVNGKKAKIIGNVCMDMIMIDVTNITCQEGDEVVIFGNSSSAEDFARTANTISYEILTGISQRIPRRIKRY